MKLMLFALKWLNAITCFPSNSVLEFFGIEESIRCIAAILFQLTASKCCLMVSSEIFSAKRLAISAKISSLLSFSSSWSLRSFYLCNSCFIAASFCISSSELFFFSNYSCLASSSSLIFSACSFLLISASYSLLLASSASFLASSALFLSSSASLISLSRSCLSESAYFSFEASSSSLSLSNSGSTLGSCTTGN